MQFYTVLTHFLPLGPKYLPKHPVCSHQQPVFSTCGTHNCHTHLKQQTAAVVCLAVFAFTDSKQQLSSEGQFNYSDLTWVYFISA
jgi:hypothetical protein